MANDRATLYMRPKNWRDYQLYHDGRELIWIKNYIALDLPGSKFRALSWADQGRLQALWRLAARLGQDGRIPYEEKYVRDALGDKRFTFASQMLPIWFAIGTQMALKSLAKRENPSTRLVQKSSLEVEVEVEDQSQVLEAAPSVERVEGWENLGLTISQTVEVLRLPAYVRAEILERTLSKKPESEPAYFLTLARTRLSILEAKGPDAFQKAEAWVDEYGHLFDDDDFAYLLSERSLSDAQRIMLLERRAS